MIALSVRGIHKRFGTHVALDDASCDVELGTVHSLVGPNGAGKTTLLRCILGVTRPDAGNITFFPGSPELVSRWGSFVGRGTLDGMHVHGHLSARRQLALYASLLNLEQRAVTEVLERVGLDPALPRLARDLSAGMRQRLALALAMLGEPPLVVLDEPLTALDPEGIEAIRRIVVDYVAAGDRSVLLSSHHLAEVMKVTDGLTVIRGGRTVYAGTPRGLLQHTQGRWRVTGRPIDLVRRALDSWAPHRSENSVVFTCAGSAENTRSAVRAALTASGVEQFEIHPPPLTLEDAYLATY